MGKSWGTLRLKIGSMILQIKLGKAAGPGEAMTYLLELPINNYVKKMTLEVEIGASYSVGCSG